MSKRKDVTLKIIVSGTEVKLEANPHQTLVSLIEQALKAAGEASDPDQWGFFVEKDKEMVSLDLHMKVEEVLEHHDTVYLNKKAGAAG